MNNEEVNILREEYKYVDHCNNGACNRNNVKSYSETAPDGEPCTDTYISCFRFTKDYQLHCEETGSVKNYPGDCWTEYVTVDIDNKENLSIALETARDTINKMESDYGISPTVLRCYFSGSKGFHILIPAALFGGFEPSKKLPAIIKKLAVDLCGKCIDATIYSLNGLIRVENTINSKSGLYKIPLLCSELLELDIEEIKQLAKARRNVDFVTLDEISQVDSLRELYESFRDEKDHQVEPDIHKKGKALSDGALAGHNDNPSNLGRMYGVEKHCISELLKGVQEGCRNNSALRIACYFIERKLNEESVLKILTRWNQSNTPPMEEVELRTTVKSAFENKYNCLCNDDLLKLHCSDTCPDFVDPDKLAPKLGELLPRAIEIFNKRSDGSFRPIATPWETLNGLLGRGLWPGVYTIVGNTGTGKSQFSIQVGLNAARRGTPVYYVGMELHAHEICARSLGILTNRKWSDFTHGQVSESEYLLAKTELEALPFHFIAGYTDGWKYTDLEDLAKQTTIHYPGRAPLIIIDYLQLVQGRKNEDLRIRIGTTANKARKIACELDAVVLMLSSTARSNYEMLTSDKDIKGNNDITTTDPRKYIGLGKESGDIEYASDGVFVLISEPWKDNTPPVNGTTIHLAIPKLRDGNATWAKDLTFDGTMFRDKEESKRKLKKEK